MIFSRISRASRPLVITPAELKLLRTWRRAMMWLTGILYATWEQTIRRVEMVERLQR